MLTLTQNAKSAITGITHEAGLPVTGGVRIVPAGRSDQVELTLAPQPEVGDRVIDDDGARVFVSETCRLLLADHTLDAANTPQGVGFSLRTRD
jgi:iron-sulfur cluster assembly protein